MRLVARLGAFALLPLLAGCFDYRQDITVSADGTAVLGMQVTMTAEMAQMAADASSGEEFCPQPDTADIPAGFTATSAMTTAADGSQTCAVTATGNIDDLQAVIDQGGLTPGDLGTDDTNPADVTITNEGNGTYSFHMAFTIPDETATGAAPTPEEQAMQAQMRTMMEQMFEGHTLTWTLTAPHILSTDGTQDGNTATFTLPLTTVATDVGKTYEFNVRFSLN